MQQYLNCLPLHMSNFNRFVTKKKQQKNNNNTCIYKCSLGNDDYPS